MENTPPPLPVSLAQPPSKTSRLIGLTILGLVAVLVISGIYLTQRRIAKNEAIAAARIRQELHNKWFGAVRKFKEGDPFAAMPMAVVLMALEAEGRAGGLVALENHKDSWPRAQRLWENTASTVPKLPDAFDESDQKELAAQIITEVSQHASLQAKAYQSWSEASSLVSRNRVLAAADKLQNGVDGFLKASHLKKLIDEKLARLASLLEAEP